MNWCCTLDAISPTDISQQKLKKTKNNNSNNSEFILAFGRKQLATCNAGGLWQSQFQKQTRITSTDSLW